MSNEHNRQQQVTNGDSDSDEPVWFCPDWELTWPIWHMLPHGERKALATKYGYHTIGEFEEYMTLRRAVGDSTELQPYHNARAYYPDDEQNPTAIAIGSTDKESLATSDSDDKGVGEEVFESTSESENGDLDEEELIDKGSALLLLPEELIHRCLEWIPIDVYATLALVSPHWKYLTRTESVYKRLCERVYLLQSKRRVLDISRFGHSYRVMLEQRPRVRAGGGFYVLKYTSVKKIERDMWTEIPAGAVLETVYYRYLYFQECGTVLYALTTDPPHVMIRRFLKTMRRKNSYHDKVVVWGTYQVARYSVTVTAQQEWHHVRFECSIQPQSIFGRFGALTLDGHVSCADGKFDSTNLVKYKVPTEMFRFLKDRRL